MNAITRHEPTRRGAMFDELFARFFGAIPDGELITSEYLFSLAQHGRDFFNSLSCIADPEGKSAGERLRAWWCLDPAANPLSAVVVFFDEILVRLKNASAYGLPHNFIRTDLEALIADVRRAVESGAAVDGGSWVSVKGRKGLVRLGEARVNGWKIQGEG